MMSTGDVRTGTMLKDNGKFGFIQQDDGEADMFVLAPLGGSLPPLGARVTYEVVTDAKTGRPRAEHVEAEGGSNVETAHSQVESSGQRAGTLVKDNGKFGFIKQDCGEEDMFVLSPPGGSLPPLGSRIVYDVVVDAKTGRPRAENTQPEGGNMVPQSNHFAGAQSHHQMQTNNRHSGTLLKDNGKFGFIQQDSGEEDMFMLPPCPPMGSRVVYDVVLDPKTGRPRAENVELEAAPMAAWSHAPYQAPTRAYVAHAPPQAARQHSYQAARQPAGTLIKDNGKFGFIQQDSGEEDMFVLAEPGTPLPPLGTRVIYDIVADAKTGRPRAENVQLEHGGMHQPPMHYSAPMHQPAFQPMYQMAPSMSTGGQRTGTVIKDNGKFGFIQQDCGEEDMFVLSPMPPVGTRVVYDVVQDAKTGRPRAENVLMEHAYAGPPQQGRQRMGTMLRDNGKFAFIQQDCGEEDMFMLPITDLPPPGFPPEGTRVMYDIVMDPKTGRPRAEGVEPIGSLGGYGPAAGSKGKGKGKAARSEPYW